MRRLSHIKQTLIDQALHLGFSHIGIAASDPVPYFTEFYRWVDAGFHADMHYLAREDTLTKRADPSSILKNCQRIICLAMPYNPPQAPLNIKRPGFGRVSAYARTKDYHLVIKDKLLQLEAHLRNQAGDDIGLKSYVDTGPVLERGFAEQAGLGMPGKNSNLIIPGTGSYVFLAVILTDLALPIDPPFNHDLCKSCQRCIEACPTDCILPDRTIDASRCISYLTIENKGIIPDALKNQLGDWLFGCDVCQMVCPHNTRAQVTNASIGHPYLPEEMELAKILTWDEAKFKSIFQNSALERTGLWGLIRNAAVVIGNQAQTADLPGLTSRLERETNPIIQDALRWAIDQIENKPANQ
ncbi:MAG: tRNA epoxyqueuosine(34) reductase QueG [Chloroflexi bacterium]|jgi:epoxyqueuosine reductase|nr:tRNA epoxyqueuosine(34) reductase QueG [Chloroflexota bacterium]